MQAGIILQFQNFRIFLSGSEVPQPDGTGRPAWWWWWRLFALFLLCVWLLSLPCLPVLLQWADSTTLFEKRKIFKQVHFIICNFKPCFIQFQVLTFKNRDVRRKIMIFTYQKNQWSWRWTHVKSMWGFLCCLGYRRMKNQESQPVDLSAACENNRWTNKTSSETISTNSTNTENKEGI